MKYKYKCDALGDKMTLLYEYGERKGKEGFDEGMKEGKKEGLKEGKKEGLKEGKKEGKKEAKEEIISDLLKSGMTCEDIAKRLNEPLNYIINISNN